jgi:hypothetical protein
MNGKILLWDVYEISSSKLSLNGVMLRGRIRKLGIENNFDVLAENTEDKENGVRFAVLNEGGASIIKKYLEQIIVDVAVDSVLHQVQNPVLSKLKVNDESRYIL